MTLIVIGLGWVLGLIPVAAWSAPWWMGAAWVAAAFPGVVSAGPLKGRAVLLGAAVLAAGTAGWRLDLSGNHSDPGWLSLVGQDVTLQGTVDSEPDRGLTVTSYALQVDSISSEGRAAAGGGRVLVRFNQYDAYLPGDRVTVRGELELPEPIGEFDYREYLASKGIQATMYRPQVVSVSAGGASVRRWLVDRRLRLDEALRRSLPEPEASLAAGIAFGRDEGLSAEVQDDFNRSGLRHLVAVSGSNVTLVAALTYFLFIPLVGRRWAWIPGAVAIIAYLGAAGLAPSVLRAGLMATIFLAGSVAGRPESGLPALVAAVMLMTAWSPGLVTDAGFLLSATATAGIIAFFPHVHQGVRAATRRWAGGLVPGWMCQVTALTLSATIATTPITWVTFGRVSFVSPLANVVVEPVFVLAFWASIVTAALASVSGTLGAAGGAVSYYPLAFITWCASTSASVPGATLSVPEASTTTALGAYALLACAALGAYRYPPSEAEEAPAVRKRRAASRRFFLAGAAGAALVAVVPISILPSQADRDLVVRFLDVGQGDAALITTPHGKQVVIDGGPSGLALARGVSAGMPHWDRSVDAVLLTHPQEDHMAGLVELARRYSVGVVYDDGRTNATATFDYLVDEFPRRIALSAGARLTIDGVTFEVLWPETGFDDPNLNNSSLVILVTFGETRFLFTGDAEDEALRLAAENAALSADVLKVPHHGSKTTGPWFFDAVHPSLAVISVGAGNQFGHPHPDTLAALSPYRVVRTDESGTVTVRTDGARLTVTTGK